MSEYNDTNLGVGFVYDTPEDKEIERLNKKITALQAEKERLEGEVGRLEQAFADGVIALITKEQSAMRHLYPQHTYGINKVCNRLKLFVGDMTKHPTQEPSE